MLNKYLHMVFIQ